MGLGKIIGRFIGKGGEAGKAVAKATESTQIAQIAKSAAGSAGAARVAEAVKVAEFRIKPGVNLTGAKNDELIREGQEISGNIPNNTVDVAKIEADLAAMGARFNQKTNEHLTQLKGRLDRLNSKYKFLTSENLNGPGYSN